MDQPQLFKNYSMRTCLKVGEVGTRTEVIQHVGGEVVLMKPFTAAFLKEWKPATSDKPMLEIVSNMMRLTGLSVCIKPDAHQRLSQLKELLTQTTTQESEMTASKTAAKTAASSKKVAAPATKKPAPKAAPVVTKKVAPAVKPEVKKTPVPPPAKPGASAKETVAAIEARNKALGATQKPEPKTTKKPADLVTAIATAVEKGGAKKLPMKTVEVKPSKPSPDSVVGKGVAKAKEAAELNAPVEAGPVGTVVAPPKGVSLTEAQKLQEENGKAQPKKAAAPVKKLIVLPGGKAQAQEPVAKVKTAKPEPKKIALPPTKKEAAKPTKKDAVAKPTAERSSKNEYLGKKIAKGDCKDAVREGSIRDQLIKIFHTSKTVDEACAKTFTNKAGEKVNPKGNDIKWALEAGYIKLS